MNKVMLIAYHFPPVRVSSGLQRTLSFAQDLKTHNWRSMVLSIHPRAFAETSEGQLSDIPEDVDVVRAQGWDTARHLAVSGRYWGAMALPDRWVSWWLGGVFSGLKMIFTKKPAIIFSTYPIATAHLIGLTLHRLTGIPWIADFRDSMTEDHYPREPRRRRVFRWIERKTLAHCSKAIFTTPSALKMYQQRYPDLDRSTWVLIPNGYNEEIFKEVEASVARQGVPKCPVQQGHSRELGAQTASLRKYTLLHSGVLYPSERDPNPFFQALAALKERGIIDAQRLHIVLRATGHDELYRPSLERLGISDLVTLADGVDYRSALAEMFTVDALLVFQSAGCNHQIPAKIYEYFRSGKPIFSLTDKAGDTASVLREAGLDDIVPLDDQQQIEAGFSDFWEKIQRKEAPMADASVTRLYSRQHASKLLADQLHALVNPSS